MSVVVAYFLPVSVLVAVTATPGSGTCPDFTVPRIVPPSTTDGVATTAGVAAGVAWAGEATGAPSCASAPAVTTTPSANNGINRVKSTSPQALERHCDPTTQRSPQKRTRKIRLPRITAEKGPSVSSVRPLLRLLRCPLPAAGDAVATDRRRPAPSARTRRSSARPVRPPYRRP